MWAQVVQGGATPEQRDEMNRIVQEQLIPALKTEPGFAGALNLQDRKSGNGMMLTLWETREQASAPPSALSEDFRKALSGVMAISTGQRAPIAVWEVNTVVMTGQEAPQKAPSSARAGVPPSDRGRRPGR